MSKAHLTAKTRKSISRPMKLLSDRGLLVGRMLDYGCGRGFDACHFNMEAYDPHFMPEKPKGKYHTITCNYVLNVMEGGVDELVTKLKSMLRVGGCCYLTVRRDILVEGKTSRGTFQKNVILDLEILHENKSFCIYILRR